MGRRLPSVRMVAVTVVGLLLLSTTVALASPGSNFAAGPQTGGTVDGKFNLNIAGFINLHTKGDLRVVDQVITIAPDGYVGWHSHPGPVLVVVKSGTFRTVQTDCSYTDYTAGEVYVDEGGGHVHNALNPGSVSTELSITYLAPPGVPLRQEASAISC